VADSKKDTKIDKTNDTKTEVKSTKKVPKIRKSSSMRDSTAKSRKKAEKPKRIKKVAGAAKKPFKSVKKALSQEYHLIQPKKQNKFLTKSRKLTPGYFRSSWAEMKLVTWPGRLLTWRLVFAVFVFALVLGTAIAVIDYGLEKLLREIIL
jgi:preprotein translocase SecE subunit